MNRPARLVRTLRGYEEPRKSDALFSTDGEQNSQAKRFLSHLYPEIEEVLNFISSSKRGFVK